MSVDYIVSSLPALAFDAPAPLDWAAFAERVPDAEERIARSAWPDLETQLRNAVAEARGGLRWKRPAHGCSLFWRNRVVACFAERDPARRDEMLDRVWWDAAGELVHPAEPLGSGVLAAYAIRLRIAIRRGAISKDAGNKAFDRLTAATADVIEKK